MTKIALVDDDPQMLELLQMLLSPHFETVRYASGEEALAGLSESLPDAMLLDIDLGAGVMNGMVVLQQLQEAGHALPVIAATARNRESDREMLIAMGFADHVSKPFTDGDMLVAVIQGCIDGERASLLGDDL